MNDHDDLDALAAAVGVLDHTETIRDYIPDALAVAATLAGGYCWLLAGSMIA